MAMSSYDELLKQVESLKSENCHLRRELKDNSSHLTKLENDASNMHDVLSHMQGVVSLDPASTQDGTDHNAVTTTGGTTVGSDANFQADQEVTLHCGIETAADEDGLGGEFCCCQ